ncbi:MAG: rod shape-determining protein MreC [Clostridiales bacterium]|nr:rod shape-determining protein MreC [Clostridiales bacterium]
MNGFKKFITGRFFLVTLSVALLISIVPAVLFAMGQGDYVKSTLQLIATPFQWAFTKVGEGVNGYVVYFRTMKDLREENAELRRELEENKGKIYDAELVREENEFIRSYLGIKAEHSEFSFEDASVIGRESTNYRTVFTLSKGSLHGIGKDMPVITPDGLVGCVTEVGPTWCRAVSLIETASSIGAYDERSGALGVVEGNYILRYDGLCRMVYIDSDADMRAGDRILSSGIGSVYPRGLAIGEVVSVEPDENTRTFTAVIRPYADTEDISRVMIITEYKLYSE